MNNPAESNHGPLFDEQADKTFVGNLENPDIERVVKGEIDPTTKIEFKLVASEDNKLDNILNIH